MRYTTTEALYALYQQHQAVSTDTRQLPKGSLFFALKGERFDGNRYAIQALDSGASYAVIDDPAAQTDARCLLVPDVLKALQALARHHRQQFHIPVLGIGGSNGKTTTKELIAVALSAHYPCHYTKGNLNNHIGVPLTLLSMPSGTEIAVIEMGANHPGDISELCEIALPTHGLITNIGKEHLEGFGNLEGVKQAEGELYRFLAKHDGCILLNASEKYLRTMARANRRQIRYQGTTEQPEPGSKPIEVQLLRETPRVDLAFWSEDGRLVPIQSHLFGRHNFQNLMTAVVTGQYFKVPALKIKTALEAYQPANNRSQLLQKDRTTIILDAYNANPSSVAAALQSLKTMEAPRKIAILGDMLELGADSLKEHLAMLRLATRSGLTQIVLVGAEFGQCDYKRYKAIHFPDAAAAKIWYDAQDLNDALVLIKGSRGIRLEQVLTTVNG
jgi:UDP-N-acetylmuramoyl-tripeptide--D-alanyl-D-alanine ligase